jgi:DNA-binding response OmpR family regulator
VDDDAAVAGALAAVLSRAGYAVTVASNPRVAETLLDDRFDALLVDLRMPGMRGDAFYYLARARQSWLSERTVFMTGDITPLAEDIVAQTRCPMLVKPFRGDALLRALQQVAPLTLTQRGRAG